ncbi:MptD family putative ECF transporter S component [Slackia heliotrinireducens]|uniref:MptD family putative ECF transporter S component n=1 Tax=Slackia heliotrinireducens TaxID=84110 RepID=UPI0033154C89
MKPSSIVRVLVASLVYLAVYPLASSSGLIHPACYAYAGTVTPLLFAFVYLYASANMQCFGAAAILNGVILVIGLVTGEGDLGFVVIIIALTAIAEVIRALCGYSTLKGVRLSFIPFAFSFYAYSAHWWTDTAGSLAAAVAEMPAGYADTMAPVIDNTPMLVVMLILVIPAALLAIRLAEKVLKKQAAELE